MRIAAKYSHLNGLEFLLVHQKNLWEEIKAVIAAVDAEACKTKKSKEKTMPGRLLYSPVDMNMAFKRQFELARWKGSRTSYWVTEDAPLIRRTVQLAPAAQKAEIEAAGRTAIYSYNQTDFVKDRIAVEVQLASTSPWPMTCS